MTESIRRDEKMLCHLALKKHLDPFFSTVST